MINDYRAYDLIANTDKEHWLHIFSTRGERHYRLFPVARFNYDTLINRIAQCRNVATWQHAYTFVVEHEPTLPERLLPLVYELTTCTSSEELTTVYDRWITKRTLEREPISVLMQLVDMSEGRIGDLTFPILERINQDAIWLNGTERIAIPSTGEAFARKLTNTENVPTIALGLQATANKFERELHHADTVLIERKIISLVNSLAENWNGLLLVDGTCYVTSEELYAMVDKFYAAVLWHVGSTFAANEASTAQCVKTILNM